MLAVRLGRAVGDLEERGRRLAILPSGDEWAGWGVRGLEHILFEMREANSQCDFVVERFSKIWGTIMRNTARCQGG